MSISLAKWVNNYKTLFLVAVLSAVGVTLVMFSISVSLVYSPLLRHSDVQVFEVTSRSSLNNVSQQLVEQKLFRYPLIFSAYARIRGVDRLIQAGEYEITRTTTPASLLQKMIRGDRVQYRITLVEGWTLSQALEEIWRHDSIIREIETSDPRQLAHILQLNTDNAEGMLFPDTYFFSKGATDIDLVKRANENLERILHEAWQNKLNALPYTDPYDALILASIIEKESAAESEKGHIAGVFVRRIELGMRLQSDPTVIYGMGEKYDGRITREDLLELTPYNTYRINGLPPTPIALAGRESIIASVNPLPSDYLYFVSQGDGRHYFSADLEEHNTAVARFRRTTELKIE